MSSRMSRIASVFARRSLIALVALAMLGGAATAALAEMAAYTPAAQQAAQTAGKSVVVHIAAPWCPTCQAQKPILEHLAAMDKFKDFVFLTVDFDNQKDAVRGLKAQSQSTLIVYKGDSEVGRSAGITDAASIEALISKAQ